jgi:glycosyltransferase involved in cell wall biosynthesis
VNSSAESKKYVIITPARNEEILIADTIQAVISQTLRPLRWVIVNDGSTDKTGQIIESYIKKYDFIRLVNLERDGDRNFGRKAVAFSHGLVTLQNLDYEYIGNLDADISIAPDYYNNIIQYFNTDAKLGIVGGIVYTKIGKRLVTCDETLDSVAGAVQLFRRSCFEAIGGYLPLKLGGIDTVAEIKARMLGWTVRKLPDQRVFEQRRMGSPMASPLGIKLREGRQFYSLGYGLLFFTLRCIYRFKDKPFIIGSIAALYGFVESFLRRQPVLPQKDIVAYLKSEQRQRLKRLPATLLGLKQ